MATIMVRRASAGFWTIAWLSSLWNAFGAYDYVMTNIRNPAYLAHVPVTVIDYVDEMPLWTLAAWTIGVWLALAGSVLLLRRSRWAVAAFVLSLAGLAASTAHQAIGGLPGPMKTLTALAMSATIWAAALFFVWFAWRSWRRGVLG